MNIKEAAHAVGCTARAIKFYEEKGLLPPISRRENGYRDYNETDVSILHEIHAYRKLGIGVAEIKAILQGNHVSLLEDILKQKHASLHAQAEEIKALERFIAEKNGQLLNESIDFPSIEQAIRAQLPGFAGAHIAAHFKPYLEIRITTPEQRSAYQRILAFWDQNDLRLPVLYRILLLVPSLLPAANAAQIDARLHAMLDMQEEEYAALKQQILRTVRMRENPLIRFSPPEMLKRSLMRSLRNCGYYDIFIPAMEELSPPYRAYKSAVTALNERFCRDLGLYYDADFNLRLLKPNN